VGGVECDRWGNAALAAATDALATENVAVLAADFVPSLIMSALLSTECTASLSALRSKPAVRGTSDCDGFPGVGVDRPDDGSGESLTFSGSGVAASVTVEPEEVCADSMRGGRSSSSSADAEAAPAAPAAVPAAAPFCFPASAQEAAAGGLWT
jgi:hypothetical protein